jgi:23S rRNA pseudouridine2604 synthase
MSEKIRLNKFISDSGVCSRREADKYIEQGHVFVNGKRAAVGDQVSARDKVMLNGNPIEAKVGNDFVFIAFNKPVGIISTTEIGVNDSIIDYIGYHERIFPVGRLDKESQGLIFLTNNGDIVNKILRAGNKHEKEYLVTVDKPVTDEFILKMGAGVPILGEMTKKCKVVKESVFSFRIVLIQGLNRQIRRMCEYFEYDVVKLERIRIMNISLKGLPLGEWRQLEAEEMNHIMDAIANSTSVAPKPPKKGLRSATASQNFKPEMRNPKPGTRNTKRETPNANPKSRELRSNSSSSSVKKGGVAKNVKPSSGSFGNRKSGKR